MQELLKANPHIEPVNWNSKAFDMTVSKSQLIHAIDTHIQYYFDSALDHVVDNIAIQYFR